MKWHGFESESSSGLHCTNRYGSPNRPVCQFSNRQYIGSTTSTNPDRVRIFCYRVRISRASPYRCNTQSYTHVDIQIHMYTYMYTYTHKYINIIICTRIHIHTRIQHTTILSHVHICAHTHTCTEINTHSKLSTTLITHNYTHILTSTYINNAHTHSYTHSHI